MAICCDCGTPRLVRIQLRSIHAEETNSLAKAFFLRCLVRCARFGFGHRPRRSIRFADRWRSGRPRCPEGRCRRSRDTNWTWWEIGGFHFTVVGEAHVASWDIREDQSSHPGIWEFGFTPVLRPVHQEFGMGLRTLVEAGVGVQLAGGVSARPRRGPSPRPSSLPIWWASALNSGRTRTIRRASGFSIYPTRRVFNTPNPGINFSQIYLQYNF